MTGCGCLLLVALLGFLLYLFTFGATDTGAPVEQAVALVIGLYVPCVMAIAGRRAFASVARS